MDYFALTRPDGEASPVLVEVPHAGLEIPEVVRNELSAPPDAVMRDADIYVDRLYRNAPNLGATLLAARVSRYVVDLNRARDDVDAATVSNHPTPVGAQPRGVVWRATTDGRPVLKRPLSYRSLLARLERFYVPYHDALKQALAELRERFGFVILLAGHSMPSQGRSLHVDAGNRRADIVPGTQGRTTCDPRIIELVDSHFRDAGFSVRHDEPYRGGYTTAHYGQPKEGVHAIQIELNRALYVHEETGEPQAQEVEALSGVLDELVVAMGRIDLKS